MQFVQKALGVAIPIVAIVAILDIPLYLTGTSLFNQQYLALFWGLATALIFLTTPISEKISAKGTRWYDVVAAVLSFILGLYVTIFYSQVLSTMAMPSRVQVVLSGMAVVLALEGIRRVAGWPVMIIIVLFILYGKFGNYAPGVLRIKEIFWGRLLTQLYLGAEFMLGIPLRVAVLVVFGFILFGQLLFNTGGGEFFVKLAHSLMGKYRGGPAKIAVLASSFFGTLAGSAMANVAGTGVVTIPMMKKTGYSPAYAGAIEATASTGGILMPPVMGASAFLIAEFLEISYVTVCIAAFVPALLYYFGTFLQIDFQAARSGIKGLPRAELSSAKKTLREGWMFLTPVLVLIIALFVLYLPPAVAALYAAGALIVVTFLRKHTRAVWSWSKILSIMQGTSRVMLGVTAICAAAGFVVGIVGYTGLGLSFSRVLTGVAGGNLFVLSVLTAVASIILGMGMPTTAAYVLLAVLAAPAMIMMGIKPLLAHLFVLYFGTLSTLTPPVCIAVYAAASISDAPPMQVAVRAMRLAVAAYIVPFIFLYAPGVALIGSVREIVPVMFMVVVAIFAFSCAFEGYCTRRLGPFERVLFLVAAFSLVFPSWFSRFFGLGIVALLLAVDLRKRHRRE